VALGLTRLKEIKQKPCGLKTRRKRK